MMIDKMTASRLDSYLSRLAPEQTISLHGSDYNIRCGLEIAARLDCDYARLYIPHENDTTRSLIFIRKKDDVPVLMLIDDSYHDLKRKKYHPFATKITENDVINQI